MKRTDQNPAQWRQEAEAQLARTPDTKVQPQPGDELLHELQVHQIELEMQNEQLRQAQVELEESRDRYVDLYEFAPVGYLTLTDKGMISEINITGSTLLGVERNKLLHHRFATFVATEDRDRWNRHFLNILTRGDTLTCELALQHGDRPCFYARLDCLCLKKNDKASVVHIVLANITERKQAEQALQESESKYRRLIENSPDISYTFSVTRGGIYFSSQVTSILGYSVEHLYDYPFLWNESIHPEDRAVVTNAIEGFKTGSPFNVEYRIKNAHGDWRWFYDRSIGGREENGDFIIEGLAMDITERKNSEVKLAESERHFRAVTESATDAIITATGAGNITGWNTAAERLFGYTEAEIIAHPLTVLIPERFRNLHNAGLARVVAGETPHIIGKTVEIFGLRKDGSEFPLELSLAQWQAAEGQFFTAIIRDITERKLAEEAIKSSQIRFSAIFNQSPLGIALIDSFTGKFYGVNPRFTEIAGRTIEEMTNIDWMSITHPDDVQEDLDNMALLNAGKIPGFTMDKRYIRPGGSIVWIKMTIAPLRVEKDVSPSHLCMIDDITGRKRAEASLRQLSLAVEQSPHSIVITGLDANIEYVNTAFVKATGYSLAEIVGQNPRILHSGKTTKASYDDLWAHLTRGEVWKGEFINRRKDGSEYIEAVLISPVRQPDGRVTNYLAIKEDITQHRQMEDALRASEAGLRTLIEHSPIAMIVDIGVDADEKIVMMNQKFTELFGYTMEDVPDVRHWWPLAYPDEKYREELKAEWIGKVEKAIQRHGDIEPMETTVTCKDVSIRHVRISLASTGNKNIITFEDLTERKLAESKLAEQLDELRRWHKATSCREARVLELKHEMNELLGKSGLPPRYPSAESQNQTEK